MVSAAWLNVRMRCSRSVVARPLGRLSMTCWLSACRSAISVDACSSLRAGRSHALGQRAAQQRDGEEAEHVQRRRCTARRRAAAARRARLEPGVEQQTGGREVLRRAPGRRRATRAQRRDQQPAAPELHGAGRDDRQHVQRREEAGDAAGEVDERRDDQRVAGELQVDQPAVPVRRSAASRADPIVSA